MGESMPVMSCKEEGKPGYKYGESGKCYTYTEGDEEGRKRSKQKAYIQGAAISSRTGEPMHKEDAAVFQDMLEEEENLEKAINYDKFVDDGVGLIIEYPEEKKELAIKSAFEEVVNEIEKFNPNHGTDGRFSYSRQGGHGPVPEGGRAEAGELGSFNRCGGEAVNSQGQKVRGVQWISRDDQFKGGCHQYVVGDRASEDKAIAAAEADQKKYTSKGIDVADVHVATPSWKGKKVKDMTKEELAECKKAKREGGCPKLRKQIGFMKMDEEQHLVYGIVLVPDIEDLQGDIVSKEDIEAAAHDYLVNSRLIKAQHRAPTDAEVVESYITQQDLPMGRGVAPAGSWIMVTKVHSNAMWAAIKKGDITGYSIGGMGTREQIQEE